jgi:hypothetical protein
VVGDRTRERSWCADVTLSKCCDTISHTTQHQMPWAVRD